MVCFFKGVDTCEELPRCALTTWNRLLVRCYFNIDEILNNTLHTNDRRAFYHPVCACPRSLTYWCLPHMADLAYCINVTELPK